MFDWSSASRILAFIGKNGRNRWCATLNLYRSRDRFWNDFDSILALKIAPKSVQNRSRKAFNFVLIFKRLPTPVKISFGSQHGPNLPPKMAPSWAKSTTKIHPKSIQHGSGSGIGSGTRFLKLQIRFRMPLGAIPGSFFGDFRNDFWSKFHQESFRKWCVKMKIN